MRMIIFPLLSFNFNLQLQPTCLNHRFRIRLAHWLTQYPGSESGDAYATDEQTQIQLRPAKKKVTLPADLFDDVCIFFINFHGGVCGVFYIIVSIERCSTLAY